MHRQRATITAAERRALRTIQPAPRGVRQPPDLKPELAHICDRAFERIVDVMEERVHEKKQKGVLTAAAMIREEILGPQAQKIDVEGNLEHILLASMANAVDPRPSGALPEPEQLRILDAEIMNAGDHADPD